MEFTFCEFHESISQKKLAGNLPRYIIRPSYSEKTNALTSGHSFRNNFVASYTNDQSKINEITRFGCNFGTLESRLKHSTF